MAKYGNSPYLELPRKIFTDEYSGLSKEAKWLVVLKELEHRYTGSRATVYISRPAVAVLCFISRILSQGDFWVKQEMFGNNRGFPGRNRTIGSIAGEKTDGKELPALVSKSREAGARRINLSLTKMPECINVKQGIW